MYILFCFKQKTAYEMRISDWSSDVCSSDLRQALGVVLGELRGTPTFQLLDDFAGASLVAGWIWSRWSDDWHTRMANSRTRSTAGNKGRMGIGRASVRERVCQYG